MSKKKIDESYQPLKRGYQPTPPKPTTGDKVQGGYQPTTSEAEPAPSPPPKKP